MSETNEKILSKLREIEEEYDETISLLEANEIVCDNKLFLFYSKQKKQLEPFALGYKNYKKVLDEIEENKELLKIETDEKIKIQLKNDIENLNLQAVKKLDDLKIVLASSKNLSKQKIIIEISSKQKNEKLSDLRFMFENFAKVSKIDFKLENLGENRFNIFLNGNGVYDKLKIFSGNTKFIIRGNEISATIVVLNDESEEFEINSEDIEIQTLKSGGAGGQHINKTESAVRAIHIPTGIVSECEDERSQTANKERAIANLKKKISEKMQQDYEKNIENQRKSLKNAVFSDTANMILDYDKNIFMYCPTKAIYKLSEILNGEISLLISEQQI